MMGQRQVEQAALFYEFSLERHIPPDHLLRSIDRFVELGELRRELGAFYSTIGRPSIDPELMIRMLIVGYCFGIRSERRLCEEVHLNLAWLCPTTPFCPKSPAVAQKVSRWLIALIFVFVIGIVHSAESAILVPLPAKSHKTNCLPFVFIFDLTHDENRPFFVFESPQFCCSFLGIWIGHIDCVADRCGTGFSYGQFLFWQQELMVKSIIRSPDGQPISAKEYPIAAFNDFSLGATNIDDDESAVNLPAVIKEKRWESQLCSSIDQRNMADTQSWAIGDQKLQSADCMLLSLDIGLLPSQQHLFFSGVRPFSHFSSLSLSSFGHDSRCFVGASQIANLNDGSTADDASKDRQEKCIDRNCVMSRPLPEAIKIGIFATFFASFFGGLVWSWWRGDLR